MLGVGPVSGGARSAWTAPTRGRTREGGQSPGPRPLSQFVGRRSDLPKFVLRVDDADLHGLQSATGSRTLPPKVVSRELVDLVAIPGPLRTALDLSRIPRQIDRQRLCPPASDSRTVASEQGFGQSAARGLPHTSRCRRAAEVHQGKVSNSHEGPPSRSSPATTPPKFTRGKCGFSTKARRPGRPRPPRHRSSPGESVDLSRRPAVPVVPGHHATEVHQGKVSIYSKGPRRCGRFIANSEIKSTTTMSGAAGLLGMWSDLSPKAGLALCRAPGDVVDLSRTPVAKSPAPGDSCCVVRVWPLTYRTSRSWAKVRWKPG